jgi:YebC/PmpR family DNA-binding regulatory protein
MSGHSHAKTIKHQKDLADKKRGAAFTKMIRLITVAVKEGGVSPEINNKLRMAIDLARTVNMPKDNIERAISRASGAEGGEAFVEFLFEAYGPDNVAILVSGITENRNRTLGEIKQILNQGGGKLVGEGAIQWMFERKGIVDLDMDNQPEDKKNKEALEMAAIEAGASDIRWYDNILEIYAEPEKPETVKKSLETKGLKVESFSVGWVPKEETDVSQKAREQNEKLFDLLDENDAVQEVYSNLKD